jgi:PPOX class probable F420-dependent enzyme
VPALDSDQAQARLAGARVVRLATVAPDGRPSLVVICFALRGDTLYSAVDGKPKRTRELARLAHIEHEPRVAVLADHYDDQDWGALWWVRAEGSALVLREGAERERALQLLVARYAQYRAQPPEGSVIAARLTRWQGWSAA